MTPEQRLELFLTTGDGSDRTYRDVQTELFTSLANKWDDTRIHVIQAPVACGKSFLARVIQRAVGAHVITPANVLIDQYTDIYRDVNFLKGKAHYRCKQQKLYTCDERKEIFGCSCMDCFYNECKARAEVEPTFFNPMSLYYTQLNQSIANLPVRVVDEAHSLLSLLSQVATKSFSKSEWNYPDNATNEIVFEKWLTTQIANLKAYIEVIKLEKGGKRKNIKKIIAVHKEMMSLYFLRDQFVKNTEQFLLYEDTEMVRGVKKRYLKLTPITVPRKLVDDIIGKNKVILMSGTMLPQDIKDLVGEEPYTYHEVSSPIPLAQRPIYYAPSGRMNASTSPLDMFNRIDSVLKKHPGLNTVIHVTYAVQKMLAPLMEAKYPSRVHMNGEEDKDKVIADFIRKGGIFLAAGCSEGLDFKDDICRLNIVPKLDFLNIGDRVVQKRRALPRGDEWFDEQAVKLFCQRYGRSTRHEKDTSITYCLDPLLVQLVNKCKAFPKYVKDAIQWYSD